MNKCCKETFKNTLKEVLLTIKQRQPKTIQEVVDFLEFAIATMEGKDSE
jgi:hypothetical protein